MTLVIDESRRCLQTGPVEVPRRFQKIGDAKAPVELVDEFAHGSLDTSNRVSHQPGFRLALNLIR